VLQPNELGPLVGGPLDTNLLAKLRLAVNVKHKLGHLTGSVEDADLVEDEAQTQKKNKKKGNKYSTIKKKSGARG
jgi:hypothetical protein